MAPPEQPADKLLVAVQGRTGFIRVQGRGSFKISTALKEFAAAIIDKGCAELILEMSDCVGMDSTFMGVLAGLAGRIRQRNPDGKIVMINLSLRTRGLLTTLGLDQVIEPYMAGSTPDRLQRQLQGTLKSLDTAEPSPRVTAETMLEAHEKLVELSPDNLPKFKDVLTFLREDLKRTEPGGPGAP